MDRREDPRQREGGLGGPRPPGWERNPAREGRTRDRDREGWRRDRDQRIGPVERQVAREVRFREDEIRPMPNGKTCNPLCPYFRCNKKALGVVRRDVSGSPRFVGYCNWVNDLCIGGTCQFSACEKFYLLPDGTCLYAVEQGKRPRDDDMLRELQAEEERAKKMRGLISRKLGGRGYDLE